MNKTGKFFVFLQLFHFGVVGILSNLVGYIFYLLLTFAGISPKISMSLLYFSGATIGFYGNSKLTFSSEGITKRVALRYSLAHLLGYLINLTILYMMVDCLGYDHRMIQAIAIFIVAMFLFVVFKYFVFRNDIISGLEE